MIKNIFLKLFSIGDYNQTHKIVYFLGFKFKYPKKEFLKRKHTNGFYYYKKNNIDITTLPAATGQIRDIQLANLELLKELDYVCRVNSLQYWLDFGSLLGAVRHKGYIPWDDDIDVGMPRQDYEKIVDAFAKTSRNPDIYAQCLNIGNNPSIIKIMHKKCSVLFVDIFPYDYYGDVLSEKEQCAKSCEIKELYKKSHKKIYKILKGNERQEILNEIKNLILKRDNFVPKSDLVWGIEYEHRWENWFSSYETIFPLKEIEFEGQKFSCINKPTEYLSRVYGNYNQYPKRIGFGHSMFLNINKKEKDIIDDLIKEGK